MEADSAIHTMLDDLSAARGRQQPFSTSKVVPEPPATTKNTSKVALDSSEVEKVKKVTRSFPLAPRKNELNLPNGEKRAKAQNSILIFVVGLATMALGGIVALLVEII